MADDTTTAPASTTSTDSSDKSSATTPAANSTSTSTTTTTPTTTPASLTGYIYDSASKTLTLNNNTAFVYKLDPETNVKTKVTGYLPEGVSVDVVNSQIVGTPQVTSGTSLTIYTPGQALSQVSIKINPPLKLEFDTFSSIYNEDGSFFSGTVIPAYRNHGDQPAIRAKAFGGTTNYSYSITGDNKGLSIDPVSGLMSGTLPSTDGEVAVTVTVTDGISTKSALAVFNVYATLPKVGTINVSTPVAWWDEFKASVSSADLSTLSRDILMAPFRTFITSPSADAVPFVSDWCKSVSAIMDTKLSSILTTDDIQTVSALSLMFASASTTDGLSVYLIRALPGNVSAVKDAIDASNAKH